MAYAYLYIGSHGCWSNDGTRYITKGEYADKLEDFPAGMAHRFAVVETPQSKEPEPVQEEPTVQPAQPEVSED
jgi:hypothetical protein